MKIEDRVAMALSIKGNEDECLVCKCTFVEDGRKMRYFD